MLKAGKKLLELQVHSLEWWLGLVVGVAAWLDWCSAERSRLTLASNMVGNDSTDSLLLVARLADEEEQEELEVELVICEFLGNK
ncbi:hypothetical protein V6N13_114133 [Hibiscus sabdariffa]